MIYIFIAVFLVLVTMNLFMLFVLRQMVRATGRQVERDAGRLFGMYDDLIEEKSRELQALEEKKRRLEAQEAEAKDRGEESFGTYVPVGISSPVCEARFQDETFSDAYRRVKKEFSFCPQELARALKERDDEPEEERELCRVLESLEELFQFDNLCRILALTGEWQEQLLKELLTPEQKAVFRQWSAGREAVDVVSFADWVKAERARLSGRMRVQVPGEGGSELGEGENGQTEEGIVYEENSALCEGARIIYKGRMYDFGI